ncbi:MAG: thioesterase family protein [Bryobacteraceae bacterium]|nr:thioesterase family protein [Bryobacteraceae bacterium]
MAQIPVGTRGEYTLLVTSDVAISFLGQEDARVLGTPWMIAYMELTSRNTIKDLLEPGEDTVGTHVDVRHLAATPLGMKVRFSVEVIEVQDRRVRFRVEARDEKDKVGEGTHERAIINVGKFAQRVQAKRTGG